MSFFRSVGGRVDVNTVKEFKVTADGTQFVTFTDNRPSTLLDEAIAANSAYVFSAHQQASKAGFYTLFITIPNDVTKQFYFDWSFASQREAKVQLIEGATVGNTAPTVQTWINRNRNSVATTAVNAASVVNTSGSEPVIGGNAVWVHYFPRDVAARHPDGGRMILKNNTVYAFKFDASNTTDNELSVRIDLAEIAA